MDGYFCLWLCLLHLDEDLDVGIYAFVTPKPDQCKEDAGPDSASVDIESCRPSTGSRKPSHTTT